MTLPRFPDWKVRRKYTDVRYETAEGIAKITINRPEVRNAFRPLTLSELMDAFASAREDREVGVIILTGEGAEAFCSGGDQRMSVSTSTLCARFTSPSMRTDHGRVTSVCAFRAGSALSVPNS